MFFEKFKICILNKNTYKNITNIQNAKKKAILIRNQKLGYNILMYIKVYNYNIFNI